MWLLMLDFHISVPENGRVYPTWPFYVKNNNAPFGIIGIPNFQATPCAISQSKDLRANPTCSKQVDSPAYICGYQWEFLALAASVGKKLEIVNHLCSLKKTSVLSKDVSGVPTNIYTYIHWLVVWTPLKNISQLGWLFPIYGKITNVPNHQPVHIRIQLMIEVGCSQDKPTFYHLSQETTISDPSGKLFGHFPGKVYLGVVEAGVLSPEIGVPPVIIHVHCMFHETNNPFGGTTFFLETSIWYDEMIWTVFWNIKWEEATPATAIRKSEHRARESDRLNAYFMVHPRNRRCCTTVVHGRRPIGYPLLHM